VLILKDGEGGARLRFLFGGVATGVLNRVPRDRLGLNGRPSIGDRTHGSLRAGSQASYQASQRAKRIRSANVKLFLRRPNQ